MRKMTKRPNSDQRAFYTSMIVLLVITLTALAAITFAPPAKSEPLINPVWYDYCEAYPQDGVCAFCLPRVDPRSGDEISQVPVIPEFTVCQLGPHPVSTCDRMISQIYYREGCPW